MIEAAGHSSPTLNSEVATSTALGLTGSSLDLKHLLLRMQISKSLRRCVMISFSSTSSGRTSMTHTFPRSHSWKTWTAWALGAQGFLQRAFHDWRTRFQSARSMLTGLDLRLHPNRQQNQSAHLWTACSVAKLENQSSVLGDGNRYPTEAME
jgi:hypothetical protein